MKIFVSLSLFIFALSFCNLSERLSKLRGDSSGNQNTSANTSVNSSATPIMDEAVEKPELTAAQRDILDSGQEIKWTEQGITYTLPKNWKKMNVGKTSLNYGSPDLAFLIAAISPMPADFPADMSLKANYESALQQLQNGKYENVRYLEIDGIKGVEFIETMPEEKGDPRRHQWIGFRTYLGQNQMLNIMTSTKGNNFEKHRDDFPAILYSMKIDK
jgi:hypothetical protein